MPKRDDALLVEDILENMKNIFEFTGGCSYEEFINSKLKVYAVVRCFEIIGEAATLISDDFKKKTPLIEW